MEHIFNVKIILKTGLHLLVETFWAIGTSIAATGVLQPHSQAHCLVAQADMQSKLAKGKIVVTEMLCASVID